MFSSVQKNFINVIIIVHINLLATWYCVIYVIFLVKTYYCLWLMTSDADPDPHGSGFGIIIFFLCIFFWPQVEVPPSTLSFYSMTQWSCSAPGSLREMPDSNPGLLPQKSGALPMSHHITYQWATKSPPMSHHITTFGIIVPDLDPAKSERVDK